MLLKNSLSQRRYNKKNIQIKIKHQGNEPCFVQDYVIHCPLLESFQLKKKNLNSAIIPDITTCHTTSTQINTERVIIQKLHWF